MATGGMAVQKRPQEARHGGDRREHAVAPPGLPHLTPPGEDGFGLPQRGPLSGTTLEDGGETRDHGATSCTIGF
jgi:hypothetical protein